MEPTWYEYFYNAYLYMDNILRFVIPFILICGSAVTGFISFFSFFDDEGLIYNKFKHISIKILVYIFSMAILFKLFILGLALFHSAAYFYELNK